MSRWNLAAMLHNKLYADIVVHNGFEYLRGARASRSQELFDRAPQVFGRFK